MDRTYRGFIAGVFAGIIMNIVNLSFYFLNLTEVKFLDWGNIFMTGQKPTNLSQMIYGLIIHIIWTAIIGVIFCYLIPFITSQGLILKGGLYAFLITFIFRSIVKLYEVSFLHQIPVQTSLLNTITAFFWGILLVIILNMLNKYED